MRAILMHSELGRTVPPPAAESNTPLIDDNRRQPGRLSADFANSLLDRLKEAGERSSAKPAEAGATAEAAQAHGAETTADNADDPMKERFLKDAKSILQRPRKDWPTLEQLATSLPDELRAWVAELRLDLDDLRNGRIAQADMSSSLLLYGPPGTGKSFLARAFAHSFGVPLIATSYTKWNNHGDGHLDDVTFAIRRDFFLASHFGPCVLFIDEIDTIPRRDRLSTNNRDWWIAITNTLLEQLSGADGRLENVILVAATNRRDSLDEALVRSGRLERQIELGAPSSTQACEAILRFHLKSDLADISLSRLACALIGRSAAAIEEIVRNARREARRRAGAMTLADLLSASALDADARDPLLDRTIAVHEAGHAFADLIMGLAESVSCSMYGVTACQPSPHLLTPDTIDRKMIALLAGRAAEHVLLGAVSSGSGGRDDFDLGKAHGLACNAVLSYGFSTREPLHYSPTDERGASAQLSGEVRREIQDLKNDAYERACALMRANGPAVLALADALQARRALDDAEIRAIIEGFNRGRRTKPRFRMPARPERKKKT